MIINTRTAIKHRSSRHQRAALERQTYDHSTPDTILKAFVQFVRCGISPKIARNRLLGDPAVTLNHTVAQQEPYAKP